MSMVINVVRKRIREEGAPSRLTGRHDSGVETVLIPAHSPSNCGLMMTIPLPIIIRDSPKKLLSSMLNTTANTLPPSPSSNVNVIQLYSSVNQVRTSAVFHYTGYTNACRTAQVDRWFVFYNKKYITDVS
jgi:hypothetical protein